MGYSNIKMEKGKPKLDGSGRGRRENKGRGGCKATKKTGHGKNRKRLFQE